MPPIQRRRVLCGGGHPILPILLLFSSLLCSTSGSSINIDLTAEVTTEQSEEWAVYEPVAPPRVHEVSVGSFGENRFKPRHIHADIGDVVRFSFNEGNHTVTESTFVNPCSARGAFDTNFFHDSHQGATGHDMAVVVDTTNPRWFFCRQTIPTSHCKSGMVFAINAGPHWFDFVARARNQSTAASWQTSGCTHTVTHSGTAAVSSAPSTLDHSLNSLISTTVQDLAHTSSIATGDFTVNPPLAWGTMTITTMITATVSVS